MVTAKTRYRCAVCGKEFAREEHAAMCESFGVRERPVPIGSRVVFNVRGGGTEEATVVGYSDDTHPWMWHADQWPDDRLSEFRDWVASARSERRERLGPNEDAHGLSFIVDEDLFLDYKWEHPHREINVDICYGWKLAESPQAADAVDPHADSSGKPSTRDTSS